MQLVPLKMLPGAHKMLCGVHKMLCGAHKMSHGHDTKNYAQCKYLLLLCVHLWEPWVWCASCNILWAPHDVLWAPCNVLGAPCDVLVAARDILGLPRDILGEPRQTKKLCCQICIGLEWKTVLLLIESSKKTAYRMRTGLEGLWSIPVLFFLTAKQSLNIYALKNLHYRLEVSTCNIIFVHSCATARGWLPIRRERHRVEHSTNQMCFTNWGWWNVALLTSRKNLF